MDTKQLADELENRALIASSPWVSVDKNELAECIAALRAAAPGEAKAEACKFCGATLANAAKPVNEVYDGLPTTPSPAPSAGEVDAPVVCDAATVNAMRLQIRKQAEADFQAFTKSPLGPPAPQPEPSADVEGAIARELEDVMAHIRVMRKAGSIAWRLAFIQTDTHNLANLARNLSTALQAANQAREAAERERDEAREALNGLAKYATHHSNCAAKDELTEIDCACGLREAEAAALALARALAAALWEGR